MTSPGQVVFDFDGTLVDTMDGIARALMAVRAEHGHDDDDIAAFSSKYASRFDVVFGELAGFVPSRRKRVYERWLQLYSAEALPEGPFHGVRQMLSTLGEAGFRIFVWTNRDSASTTALVRDFGLQRFVRDKTCGDSGLPAKPSPDALVAMLGQDCDRDRAWVVGDSITEIEAGLQFGAGTIGACWCDRASAQVLRVAGAHYIAQAPEDVVRTILE